MITVNRERVVEVFGLQLDAFYHNGHPYDLPDAILPQAPENLPESLRTKIGSREHAMFLFILCYWMRGGIKSYAATRALTRLYDRHPHIFLPESEPEINEDELLQWLKDVGLNFIAKEVSKKAWKRNLRTIARLYAGDPRNIFAGINTYEEACERIQNKRGKGFYGFQEKMVSMIIYFFMDAGIVDRWHFPIPVDFHVLRTVFAHEIVIADAEEKGVNGFYTKPILATVRELSYDYCVKDNVDPVDLCSAVWLYSGIMCSEHPGNQSKSGRNRGRDTEIWPVERWTLSHTRAFERTCRVCSLRSTCRWCVPAKEYYIGGRVVLREERDDDPPQRRIFHD